MENIAKGAAEITIIEDGFHIIRLKNDTAQKASFSHHVDSNFLQFDAGHCQCDRDLWQGHRRDETVAGLHSVPRVLQHCAVHGGNLVLGVLNTCHLLDSHPNSAHGK